jgi:hypothetical protein
LAAEYLDDAAERFIPNDRSKCPRRFAAILFFATAANVSCRLEAAVDRKGGLRPLSFA